MALRLNRSVRNESTATPQENLDTNNGFNLDGTSGINYDLDQIVESKKRSSTGELLVQNTDKKNKKEGTIAVKTSEGKILMNNADAAKYLFGNEPSTNAYSPAVTLRRPIVIWEEGTLDDGTSERSKGIYDEILSLETKLKNLESSLNKKIDEIKDETDHSKYALRSEIPSLEKYELKTDSNFKFSNLDSKINSLEEKTENIEIYGTGGVIHTPWNSETIGVPTFTYAYDKSTETYSVNAYYGNKKEIKIPKHFEGIPVTKIGSIGRRKLYIF